MINFLAEVSVKNNELQIQPTPSNEYTKDYNIYELDISTIRTHTYWEDWGGYFDNFQGTNIQLYYNEQYLMLVSTLEELFENEYSMYFNYLDDTGLNIVVLMNLPKHPWLYSNYIVTSRKVIPFVSSPLNQDNPSYNILRGEQALTRLEIPNILVKLSDNLNGVSLNQGFNVNFINNDGFFDDDEKWNVFNAPLVLKKSVKDNPEYNDFKNIRFGYVENATTTFDSFNLSINDMLKNMEAPVCKLIQKEDYIGIDFVNDLENKTNPVLYGLKTFELSDAITNGTSARDGSNLGEVVFLMPEYTKNVVKAFDKDKNLKLQATVSSFYKNWMFDLGYRLFYGENIKYVRAIGKGNNEGKITIGEVVKDLIMRANISYSRTFWNIEETDDYISNSNYISMLITDGTIRNAISEALKNDMAYLIQQNDGRLTIRQYGKTYATHQISSSMLTKKPEKNYDKAQENYLSSCIINYTDNPHVPPTILGVIIDSMTNDKIYLTKSSYLYQENEPESIKLYNKRIQKVFETELMNVQSAEDLAKRLSARYSKLKQRVKISLGVDTSNFELLDTVKIELNINNRRFNNINEYYIIEINPSQDTLVLEEI
jgi:hypothetical protein